MRSSFFTLQKRIVTVAIIVSFFTWLGSPIATAFTITPANVVGWAWNSVAGWIKMSGDIVDASGVRSGSYGVKIDRDGPTGNDGIVSGWSWSSNYGWICWGVTCAGPLVNGTTPPPGGSWETRVINLYSGDNASSYNVNGWAKVVALGDDGIVSLSDTSGSNFYQLQFEPGISEFRGWAWNGGAAGLSIGWIAFSGATISPTLDCIVGSPTYSGAGPCSSNFAAGRSLWATQIIDKWIQTKRGSIYAQGGFNQLSSPTPETNNKFSADYLIHSPATIGDRWNPACKSTTATGTNPSDIPLCSSIINPDDAFDNLALSTGGSSLPKNENNYKNALGSINVVALTDISNLDAAGRNRYGFKVLKLSGGDASARGVSFLGNINAPLDENTVFFSDGDMTLDYTDPTVRTFLNAPPSKFGARTIIVKGDLIFKKSLVYESVSSIDSVKRLASVAWIAIKNDAHTAGGNIIIDNCIDPVPKGSSEPAMLVGSFIAEGTIKTGTGEGGTSAGKCSNLKVDITIVDTTVTPNVSTTTTQYVNVAIHILGTMMAKHFDFERKQVDYEQGSELIDYDGRVTVNTPPGLEDFAKQLPTWRTAGF